MRHETLSDYLERIHDLRLSDDDLNDLVSVVQDCERLREINERKDEMKYICPKSTTCSSGSVCGNGQPHDHNNDCDKTSTILRHDNDQCPKCVEVKETAVEPLYKKNLRLLLEHWNGEFGSESNIEIHHKGAEQWGDPAAISLRDAMSNEVRLTRAYVESLNPGYEAIEYRGEIDNDYGQDRQRHGWLLRKKIVAGCRYCKKCREITLRSGSRAEVICCTREVNESCGAPYWPCFESREA